MFRTIVWLLVWLILLGAPRFRFRYPDGLTIRLPGWWRWIADKFRRQEVDAGAEEVIRRQGREADRKCKYDRGEDEVIHTVTETVWYWYYWVMGKL